MKTKEERMAYQRAYHKEHYQKPKPLHTCIECGVPVYKRNSRCHRCGGLYQWRVRHIEAGQSERTIPKYCVDCGKQIKYTRTRCQHCSRVRNCTLRVGPKNPCWKGERLFHSNGYVRIYRPEHPRASKSDKRVFEHIVVWEEAHRKPLPKGWHIHHLNGNKGDNRIINLEGLPSKAHYLVLQAKAKRIQELEALLNSQHQLL